MKFYMMIFGLSFMVYITSAGGINLSEKMQKLLENLPWAKTTEAPKVSTCKITKCDEYFTALCQNGGKCVVAKNCHYKCKCPRGYVGIFCGVKTTVDVTTFSVEITTSLQKVPSTSYLDIKTSSTQTSKQSSRFIHITGIEHTTQKNEPTMITKSTPTEKVTLLTILTSTDQPPT
ncbi:hypothetical protein ACF0H5_004699 [Mactra antiquata]